VESFSTQIEAIGSDDPVCQRLREIPGVGPLIASAVVASVGNGAAFHKGREFAAWLGLIPKQYSTGGTTKLLGISKRGNRYLRTMFIHGARSLVLRVNREHSPLGGWISSLEARAHRNVVIVAMANKLARITWAVLSSGERYRPATVAA
jgi:transposase